MAFPRGMMAPVDSTSSVLHKGELTPTGSGAAALTLVTVRHNQAVFSP